MPRAVFPGHFASLRRVSLVGRGRHSPTAEDQTPSTSVKGQAASRSLREPLTPPESASSLHLSGSATPRRSTSRTWTSGSATRERQEAGQGPGVRSMRRTGARHPASGDPAVRRSGAVERSCAACEPELMVSARCGDGAGHAASAAAAGLEQVGPDPPGARRAGGQERSNRLRLLTSHHASTSADQRLRAALPVVPTDQPRRSHETPSSLAVATASPSTACH